MELLFQFGFLDGSVDGHGRRKIEILGIDHYIHLTVTYKTWVSCPTWSDDQKRNKHN